MPYIEAVGRISTLLCIGLSAVRYEPHSTMYLVKNYELYIGKLKWIRIFRTQKEIPMFKFLKLAFAAVVPALVIAGNWLVSKFKKLNVVFGDWSITIVKTAAA